MRFLRQQCVLTFIFVLNLVSSLGCSSGSGGGSALGANSETPTPNPGDPAPWTFDGLLFSRPYTLKYGMAKAHQAGDIILGMDPALNASRLVVYISSNPLDCDMDLSTTNQEIGLYVALIFNSDQAGYSAGGIRSIAPLDTSGESVPSSTSGGGTYGTITESSSSEISGTIEFVRTTALGDEHDLEGSFTVERCP